MEENRWLEGVEDTVYIPLVARIYVSEHFPDFFYDEKALSLKRHIPADGIKRNSTEYVYMASVCRQETMDKKICEFIERNRDCNVVFLGAGLETAVHRIKNRKANFYQVDLPPVIGIRENVLGTCDNERLIGGDMFTLEWIQEIDVSLSTLLVVAGVYSYFHKEKIVGMIQEMKSLLPKGELIFDTTNATGLTWANNYVRKTGNTGATMYFSVDDPREFARVTGTKLKGVYGFFAGALKDCKGLKVQTRIYMYLADKLHRTMIIHLRFH